VKFRFSPISKEAQVERLTMICEKEGIKLASPQVLLELVDISQGDLRRSINTLQTASSFKHKLLTVEDIRSISGIVPDETILKIEKVLSTTDGF
jgi:DNA polymerase III delta prime subunit